MVNSNPPGQRMLIRDLAMSPNLLGLRRISHYQDCGDQSVF